MDIINLQQLISKSSYLRGRQCIKSLFLERFNPDLRKPADEQLLNRYRTGYEVGVLARQLFPNGVEVYKRDSGDLSEAIRLTKHLIDHNGGPIYEGVFLIENLLAITDILVPGKEGWNLYEVKSAMSISEINIDDISYQFFVLTKAGVKLKDVFIVYLNGEYVRHGKLELKELFVIESLLDMVLAKQDEVKSCVKQFGEVLQGDVAPSFGIGVQCLKPYKCDFKDHCWRFVPHDSVFDVNRLRNTQKFDLYHQGIQKMEDIPDSYPLNYKQQIQVESHVKKAIHVDKDKIKEFLQSLKYPIFCLDFESIMPAVPMFENTRVYQQIVFQYSLHILKSIHEDPVHFEFLADSGSDPRPEFIRQLLSDIKGRSHIIVYNATFEVGRLRELALDFNQYSEEIENIISRIKDLLVPFRERFIYHPQMCGSNSLKSVVPALIPELSYSDLEISDGTLAMNAYEQLLNERDGDKINQIRNALLRYCERDTLCLVKIIQKLEELAIG